MGLFVQPDTIVPWPGNPQALNRYAYALQYPLCSTDPSGQGPRCIPIALGVLKLLHYGWTASENLSSRQTGQVPQGTCPHVLPSFGGHQRAAFIASLFCQG